MSKKLFVSVGADLIETDIDMTDVRDAEFILVRIGNDQFPVMDVDQIESAKSIIEPMLREAGVKSPILFWNHVIQIDKIKIKPGE